jgi:hypothetical protein
MRVKKAWVNAPEKSQYAPKVHEMRSCHFLKWIAFESFFSK